MTEDKPLKENGFTNVRVSKRTRSRIERFKLVPSESNESVITRALEALSQVGNVK